MITSESAYSVLFVSGSWLLGYWEMSRNPTSSLHSVLLHEASFLNAVFYHEFTIFSQKFGCKYSVIFYNLQILKRKFLFLIVKSEKKD